MDLTTRGINFYAGCTSENTERCANFCLYVNEDKLYIYIDKDVGTAVAKWLRCCATNRKVAGSIPAGVIGIFIDIKSFRSHYDPGVVSASNRNKYLEHFLGGKGGRFIGLTNLPPSCAVLMKSGNLNSL